MGRLLLFLVCVGVVIAGVMYLSQEKNPEKRKTATQTVIEEEQALQREDIAEEENEATTACEAMLDEYEQFVNAYSNYCDTVRAFDISDESITYSKNVAAVQSGMNDNECTELTEHWSRFAMITSKYAQAISKLQSRLN